MIIAESAFIHQYVPPDDPRLPTVLLLHGTGGDEMDLIPLARQIAPGAALLSPRGRVLENHQPRFFRRFEDGSFDREDLVIRAAELAGFVRTAAEDYGFDARRVAALGYSNGANMAAALLLLHPQVLAAAMLFRAQLPLRPPRLPDLSGMPVYLGAGRNDELIPAVETQRLETLLKDCGAYVAVRWQDAGHALHPQEIAPARHWFARLRSTAPETLPLRRG